MKKVSFITQSKGGTGKSILTYMYAEKYLDAKIIDLDDSTKTSSRQLAYRNPTLMSFIDPLTKRIDRGRFDELFEKISQSKNELFVADLGASVAEVLPFYFEDNVSDLIAENLKNVGIELELLCVIAGENNFIATFAYLVALKKSVGKNFKIVAVYNRHFSMTEDQLEVLNKFCKSNDIEIVPFDLVKEKGESALRTIAETLQKGLGIAAVSSFKRIYFEKGIQELAL